MIFSFNYNRHVLAMTFPAVAMMTAPLVERLGVSLIEVRWIIDFVEILLLLIAVILWIAILRKQKKAILVSVQKFLGTKNSAEYKIIEKSLYIVRFMRFSLNHEILKDIKKINSEVEFAIAQINRIISISTITVFGSIAGAAFLVSVFITMFSN